MICCALVSGSAAQLRNYRPKQCQKAHTIPNRMYHTSSSSIASSPRLRTSRGSDGTAGNVTPHQQRPPTPLLSPSPSAAAAHFLHTSCTLSPAWHQPLHPATLPRFSRWRQRTPLRCSPNPASSPTSTAPSATAVTTPAIALDVEYAHYITAADSQHVSAAAWVALVDEHCNVLLKTLIQQQVCCR